MVGFTCSNRDCGWSLGNTFEEKEVSTHKNWLKREPPSLEGVMNRTGKNLAGMMEVWVTMYHVREMI